MTVNHPASTLAATLVLPCHSGSWVKSLKTVQQKWAKPESSCKHLIQRPVFLCTSVWTSQVKSSHTVVAGQISLKLRKWAFIQNEGQTKNPHWAARDIMLRMWQTARLWRQGSLQGSWIFNGREGGGDLDFKTTLKLPGSQIIAM